MKKVSFSYCSSFHCLAGSCPDTCCKDWQIILDEKAIARYNALDGALGEAVRKAMITENGETRFAETDGFCVLLRPDGLCPIQAELGEAALCTTCDSHPRFIEEYGQTQELSLSISCPEAARLLLTQKKPLTFRTEDDRKPILDANDLDPQLYLSLLASRTTAFRLMQDRTRPISHRLALLLLFSKRVQRLLDSEDDTLIPVLAKRFCNQNYLDRSLVRLSRFLRQNGRFFPCWMLLNNMEHLTKDFTVLLDRAANDSGKRASFLPCDSTYYENLSMYFLFRYFMKAINDRQLFPKVESIVFHLVCIRELFSLAADDSEKIRFASLYSKEVEHSEENLQLLSRVFSRNTIRWQYFLSILDD